MVTSRGVSVAVLGVLTLLLAGFTRIGWLLLFDAILWSVVAISAVMPWLAAGRLRGRRRVLGWGGRWDDPGPTEGEDVEFQVTLRNDGLLPAAFVRLALVPGGKPADPDRSHLLVAWLRRNQEMATVGRFSFSRRGRHALPPVLAETSLPFGLFRRSIRLGEATGITVLPRVYTSRRLHAPGGVAGSADRPLQGRMGEQVAGSRNYVSGDPLRQIHWRNAARSAQLQVKELYRSPERSQVILLDTARIDRSGPEYLDDAVRLAASVGDPVCRSGGTVLLRTGHAAQEFTSPQRLLLELALLEAGTPGSPEEIVSHLPPSSDVIAITVDSDSTTLEALGRLADGLGRVVALVMRTAGHEGNGDRVRAVQTPTGVEVVTCSLGKIPQALDELAGLGLEEGLVGPVEAPVR